MWNNNNAQGKGGRGSLDSEKGKWETPEGLQGLRCDARWKGSEKVGGFCFLRVGLLCGDCRELGGRIFLFMMIYCFWMMTVISEHRHLTDVEAGLKTVRWAMIRVGV